MRKFVFFLCIASSLKAVAQTDTTKTSDIYKGVEQIPMPKYDVNKYISTHLRYPFAAVQNNIAGRVRIGFVIDSVGKIENVKVLRSVDPLLDAEAVRVISEMPDWVPGRRSGKPVNLPLVMGVVFQISSAR